MSAKLPCVMCEGRGYSTGLVVPAALAIPCGCHTGQHLRALPIEWPAYPRAIKAALDAALALPVEVKVTPRVPPPELTPIRRAASARLFVLCACGHWIDWRAARFVGVMRDDVEALELRDCQQCGSTRALQVARLEE